MYIDYIKKDYSSLEDKERELNIQRDKKHLGKIFLDKIESELESIVDRWWYLESVNGIIREEYISRLLEQAEQLYINGNFSSSITIAGVLIEEISSAVCQSFNIEQKFDNQFERLNELKKRSIIDKNTYIDMNDIRVWRNNAVHLNEYFKRMDIQKLEVKAKEIIAKCKNVLKRMNYFEEIKLDELGDNFTNKDLSFEEFKMKNRNVQYLNEGFDAQISPYKSVLSFTSNYYIAEIDIDKDLFKEMTLVDLDRGGMFVLDLTLPDVVLVKKLKLEEKNVIIATVISKVTTAGLTEEWKLLEIHKVFRGYLEL